MTKHSPMVGGRVCVCVAGNGQKNRESVAADVKNIHSTGVRLEGRLKSGSWRSNLAEWTGTVSIPLRHVIRWVKTLSTGNDIWVYQVCK